MTSTTVTSSPIDVPSKRPALRERLSTLTRARSLITRAVAVGLAAAALSACVTAPASAGIPDPDTPDYLRMPLWTSLTMNPQSPSGAPYQYWTQIDASLGGTGTQSGNGAPNVGTFADTRGGGYIAATPSGKGLYFIDEIGNMRQTGDATAAPTNIAKVSKYYFNDNDGTSYNPISSLAVTPSGQGGWVLDTTGHVWTFGDARSFGSVSGQVGDAVDIAPTSTGLGYTILTNQGDIYDFGDAVYYGHPKFKYPSLPTDVAATGIALTPDDKGYWILDSFGGIHAYGNAPDLGNGPTQQRRLGPLHRYRRPARRQRLRHHPRWRERHHRLHCRRPRPSDHQFPGHGVPRRSAQQARCQSRSRDSVDHRAGQAPAGHQASLRERSQGLPRGHPDRPVGRHVQDHLHRTNRRRQDHRPAGVHPASGPETVTNAWDGYASPRGARRRRLA
jgi:hypothetical protein